MAPESLHPIFIGDRTNSAVRTFPATYEAIVGQPISSVKVIADRFFDTELACTRSGIITISHPVGIGAHQTSSLILYCGWAVVWRFFSSRDRDRVLNRRSRRCVIRAPWNFAGTKKVKKIQPARTRKMPKDFRYWTPGFRKSDPVTLQTSRMDVIWRH